MSDPNISVLRYMDDSGSARSQLAIVGWIEVSPAGWSAALSHWLDLRAALWEEYRVPSRRRLHATEFVNGRGKISRQPPERYVDSSGRTLWKDLGREIAQRSLAAISDMPGIATGAAFRRHGGDGKHHATVEYQLYEDVVAQWNDQLARQDTYGLVAMDGADIHYTDAHRAIPLAGRRLIEDPFMQDARRSQWMQIADLVAYTANLHFDRHRGNQFGQRWWNDYLATRCKGRWPGAPPRHS